ncbi:MAG: metallophosphoesterase [Pedobacter sp.]|nr:MAG: metallophosphoesterase [Pedobacter sp.]
MKRKISILPLLLIFLFFIALNWYVLSGIQIVFTSPTVIYGFWIFILIATGLLVYSVFTMQSRGMGLLFKFSTHLFLILFTAEVVFAIVLLIGDIYRLLLGVPRSVLWIDFDLILIFLLVLAFTYGIVRGKYAYRVVKHTLHFKDLPAAFDGFTITQISDVHAGSFTNPAAVQRGIDLIKAQKSDLFVFTGDMVNNKAEEIQPWLDHFSQIKAPYGQFSVLGNHDYGDYVKWENELIKQGNLQQLKKYHAELGYRLLLDEHVELQKDGQKIILAGVENWGLGFGERGDLQKALNGTQGSDFKVLLSHDPSHWEAQVKTNPSKVHLTLAGHTHGMQFGIEAFGIKWSPVKYRYAHWAGVKEDNGRYLNVNRGFGFIGFSGRVGIWPEITVIELKRTAD